MPAKEDAKYICGYVIYFSDGGEPEGQVLGRGTLEECMRIGNLMLAVSYSGSRPNPKAEFVSPSGHLRPRDLVTSEPVYVTAEGAKAAAEEIIAQCRAKRAGRT